MKNNSPNIRHPVTKWIVNCKQLSFTLFDVFLLFPLFLLPCNYPVIPVYVLFATVEKTAALCSLTQSCIDEGKSLVTHIAHFACVRAAVIISLI